MTVKELERNILRLSPVKRIRIVEHILASLDTPDMNLERAWGMESDKRLENFRHGKAKSINAQTLRKKISR